MTGRAADGGLNISEGGIVAVDTGSLRDAASALAPLVTICADLSRACEQIARSLVPHFAPATSAVELAFGLGRRFDQATSDANELAEYLDHCASVFEIVEVDVQRAVAELAGDDVAATVLTMHLALLRGVAGRLVVLVVDTIQRTDDYRRLGGAWTQAANLTTALGPWSRPMMLAASGLLAAVAGASLGPVPRGGALVGKPTAVRVDATPQPSVGPPSGLQTLAHRMPQGDDQIRVERYARADGGARFVVYVAGTKSPLSLGGAEPWDMASNVELYTRRESASYAAVVEALREAGAGEGDTVLAVGHSQGAAVTSQLALSGDYRVEANVMFGSPVAADLPEGVLDVNIRHTDDLVPLLQAGGHPVRTGSEHSFIAERAVDPTIGLADLQPVSIAAHDMVHYAETAALIDASRDPQVAGLRELLDDLGSQGPAEVTTFRARRPDGADDIAPPPPSGY